MSNAAGQGVRKVFAARLFCAAGMFLAVIGAFFISVALNILGMVLGMIGYALGARGLGPATVALSLATLFVGLHLGQGALPGAYDRVTDGLVE
ncbi:hypothetical protein BH23ACT11_BH23ACT11_25470 [soil metagenome]